ncbi:hypothetical protein QJQ45_006461 [Haematococcus lacustris]|nr:hypothetical protein QJQ45_006461 [Haematococcus lacustris]
MIAPHKSKQAQDWQGGDNMVAVCLSGWRALSGWRRALQTALDCCVSLYMGHHSVNIPGNPSCLKRQYQKLVVVAKQLVVFFGAATNGTRGGWGADAVLRACCKVGKGKAHGKAAKAKPAPQPGRWLDRDCNAALNMQRIGKSRWRPLELRWGPDMPALPAKSKEYPGLGYKRVQDKPPPQQQQQPAEAQ